jgi:branched-chain amino acid transport system substrate-binding protein
MKLSTVISLIGLALIATRVPVAEASSEAVRIGVIISETGPAASLGIPQRNTLPLLDSQVSGHPVQYILMDDKSDPIVARQDAIELADSEKVDAIVGPSTTLDSLAIANVLETRKLVGISLAAGESLSIVAHGSPSWVFQTAQRDSLMLDAIVDHMHRHGVTRIAFIGQNDPYGDDWLSLLREKQDISVVDVERFSQTDTSVTWQVLKALDFDPQAVLIASAGTSAAIPQRDLRERHYLGKIYQTHGAANFDYIRRAGNYAVDTILPLGPVAVADQLDPSDPIKVEADAYVSEYERRYHDKPRATFGAHLYDAWILLRRAIPIAIKAANPGSPEFRANLRAALEQLHDVVTTQGVVSMSSSDHNGLDTRARRIVTIDEQGNWIIDRGK